MGFRLANVDGRAALVAENNYFDLENIADGKLGSDPMVALDNLDLLHDLNERLADKKPTGKLASAKLGSPVPRPNNGFGVGLNYLKHAEESGMDVPIVPMVFAKFQTSISGPADDVVMRSDYVDYEGELVFVVGKGGKDIPVENAWNHVAGLTVGNDFTDRCVQFMAGPPQFNLGKSMDTFSPMGPVLVSPDLFEDPNKLELTVKINGVQRQKETTDDLIFDVPTLVSYLSHLVTLNTGDVIFTGTPVGVGAAEASFLKAGDVVVTSIAGIGSISNKCVRGSDHPYANVVPPIIQNLIDKNR